jgi:phasin family protein
LSDTETEVKVMENQMQDAIAASQSAFNTSMVDATAGLEKTQAQVKEHMEKAMKKAEEMASFSQGTVEALVKSGQIWSAGVQDLSKQMAATAQSQLEQTLSTFRALSGLRSLKDMMELQASYARASMEKAMAETGRLTDASFKLAEQTMAPLSARVSLAVESFSKAA